MLVVDANVALSALRDLVSQKGDLFVYEKPEGSDYCLYTTGEVPSCGVGQVLFNLGVPFDKIKELDDLGTSPTEFTVENTGLFISNPAARLFDLFQYHQDRGWTYRKALEDVELLHRHNLETEGS